jgi:hypothetical protein
LKKCRNFFYHNENKFKKKKDLDEI